MKHLRLFDKFNVVNEQIDKWFTELLKNKKPIPSWFRMDEYNDPVKKQELWNMICHTWGDDVNTFKNMKDLQKGMWEKLTQSQKEKFFSRYGNVEVEGRKRVITGQFTEFTLMILTDIFENSNLDYFVDWISKFFPSATPE